MNHKHALMLSQSWLATALLLLMVLLLSGCGSLNAEVGYYATVVNPDLSGHVDFMLVMTPGQYNDLGWYYGDFTTTDRRFAQDIAEGFEWRNYTWDKSVENGRHVVVVQNTFADNQQFNNEILRPYSGIVPQGAESIPSHIPDDLHRTDNLFNTVYTFLVIIFSGDGVRFPFFYTLSLPGSIILTDGSVENGLVVWPRPSSPKYVYAVSAALPQYDVRFEMDFSEAEASVLSITVLAPQADMEQAASIYGSGNTNEILADVWARNLGLIDYTLSSRMEGERQALTLTSVYKNQQELVSLLNTSPLFSGVEVKRGGSLFNNEFVLSGTLVPSDEHYGAPDNMTLVVRMPGMILTDDEGAANTAGRTAPLSETNSQAYVWGAESVPLALTSSQSQMTVFAGIGAGSVLVLCGGLALLIGVAVYIFRRQAQKKQTI